MANLTVSQSESPLNQDVTLLTAKGFMDTTTASIFEESFKTVLKEGKFKLVINLAEVDYISSAGWGLFVSEIKAIRNGKGDLVLAGMNPNVTEVFELLEFDTILKSFPDVESAVRKSFGLKSPSAGKAVSPLPAKKGKKTTPKAAALELTQEPVPLAAPPTEPSPAPAPEPQISVVRGTPKKGALSGWRFGALVLVMLAALGIYGIISHPAWRPQGLTLPHWVGIK